MMARRWIGFGAIALALVPFVARAGGPGTTPATSAVGGGAGLVISLSVPRPSYPLDALVQTTVHIWNDSGTPVQFTEPTVDVLWPSGKPAPGYSGRANTYPAGVVSVSPPFKEPTGGGPPFPPTIFPGRVIVRHVFVILGTGRLQAAMAFGSGDRQVETGILHLRILSAPFPRISIHRDGDGSPVAIITPATSGEKGSVWYMSAARCGFTATGTIEWTRVPSWDRQSNGSYEIPTPDCAVTEWSIAAGWLGRPLATAHWSRRGG